MDTQKTVLALEMARDAHASINQKRKYSGDDYIVHPIRVAAVLRRHGVTDEDVLCAAYLHDVIEDVWPLNAAYEPRLIMVAFGGRVWKLVDELTDEYTHENYPELNRLERKVLEAFRISKISNDGLKIKLADLIDNTHDIVANDPDFAVRYLEEKRRILRMIKYRTEECYEDSILKALYAEAVHLANQPIPKKS